MHKKNSNLELHLKTLIILEGYVNKENFSYILIHAQKIPNYFKLEFDVMAIKIKKKKTHLALEVLVYAIVIEMIEGINIILFLVCFNYLLFL